MTSVQETTFGPQEYLASLRLDEDGPSPVVDLDGAVLYRVADDHFMVMVCTEHQHRGHELLLRVMPQDWVCFSSVFNADVQFECHHYGPDIEEIK